jgi:CRISP-associated protein Cas1
MSYRVVDLLNFQGQIHTARGRLVIDSKEIPLEETAALLIGSGAQLSGGVIQLCARFEVPILTCDWRGLPVACTYPWSENSKVARRFRAQIECTVPKQKNAWMQIISAKIEGQARNLEQVSASNYETLMELSKQVRSGDPENLEARAARTYWSSLFEKGSFSRSPGSGIGMNPYLDYGYAILRSVVIRAICEAGLNPTIGIFHRNRSNPFCLADDLIEPFRPVIDFIVLNELAEVAELDKESKAKLVASLSMPLQGTGETVQTAIENLASRFAAYCEGDTTKLEVSSWRPG